MFYLNHQTYTQAELVQLALNKVHEGQAFEKPIYQFILDWFNPATTLILKTSGTTGPAKTITANKAALQNSALATLKFFNLKPQSNALLCLSANFIAGKMMIVRALLGRLNLITVEPSSTPYDNLEQNLPIDFVAMVPLQVESLVKKYGASIFNTTRNIIIGGANISERLQQILPKLQPNIFATFGMTETLSHIAIANAKKQTLIYQVLDNVTIEKDQNNYLIIDAPQLDVHRLQTNDVVEIIDKKHFKWIGRADNVINSGGIKLHPEILEDKLRKCFLNDTSFVLIGLPDDLFGEKIVLVIETTVNYLPSNMLRMLKNAGLEKYEVPKSIEIIHTFPRTETGKIKRKAIKELLTGLYQ